MFLCLTQYLKVLTVTDLFNALKMTCITQNCVNALIAKIVRNKNDDIASYIEIKDEID